MVLVKLYVSLCGLVNFAGIVSLMSLVNTTEEKFDDVIRVKLISGTTQ